MQQNSQFGGVISGLGSGLTIRFGGAIDGMDVLYIGESRDEGLKSTAIINGFHMPL